MVRPVRTWLRRANAAGAAALTMPAIAVVSNVTPTAGAFSRQGLPVEYLDVYSAATSRNIRVQFPPANGAPTGGTANGWDVETPAFEWFLDSGVATVMSVGSPSNFNDQTYTYKWETFLTSELPSWLAAHKQTSATGNGVVGLWMSGGPALIVSADHPAQFRYAASLSGFMNPSALYMEQAGRVAMMDAGGYNVDNMWGAPRGSARKNNDPIQLQALTSDLIATLKG